MKKRYKILISFILILLFIIFNEPNKVHAKSYYIDDMNIQGIVLENGDLEIEQTLKYSFNGSYNGIYITIPTKYKNKEEKISKISDDIYNAQGVELQKVSQIKNGETIEFQKVNYASNGQIRVYTEEVKSDIYKLKVFCPTENGTKTFKLNYILKNVCVSHNDIGELYYNFIGGDWECTIKNLKIDIYLPNNQKELKIWGHGPDNGESEIVDNTHVRLRVTDVPTGKYVAGRVLFDNSNIPNAQKTSNIDAYNIIYEDEQQIAKINDRKRNYTQNIYLFALALIVYWIILLIIYEKDKKVELVQVNDEELFKKYNPMIAGCLQGSRDILARDIIAVILNLIENENINLEIKKVNSESYGYYLSKVSEKENTMDEIETIIYEWLFEGDNTVELTVRLEEMPKDKQASKKFEKLNDIVQEKLNQKGANEKKVPVFLRVFNTFLFFITIYVAIKHIMYEGFEIYNGTDILLTIIPILIYTVPFAMILMYIPVMLLVNVRHQITKLVHKVTGQKVVTTAVTIIAIFLVIILLTVLIANKANKYIVADEILLCISLIIMLTDNLMLKNSVKMIEDYSKINGLKQKIENYTMMEDRDVEQVTLWGKYLAYSVSFGIADKICKRIKGLYVDDDLLDIINNKKMVDYIFSDYSLFYYSTSLDRRFMKGYTNAINKVASSHGSGSSSGGSGGGFSGGGGFSRRWRLSEEAGGAF